MAVQKFYSTVMAIIICYLDIAVAIGNIGLVTNFFDETNTQLLAAFITELETANQN